MPGSFCSCSTRRANGSGKDTIKTQSPKPKTQNPKREQSAWDLGFGIWVLPSAGTSEAGNLETAHQPAHRLTELLVHLAAGIVDRGHDQVLQHLDVVFGDDFGI